MMKKISAFLSLSTLLTLLVFAQDSVVNANQETKPNPPIPSDVAKNLLVTGEQDDDSVENPPIPSDTAKDLLVPGAATDTETVENPPMSEEVAKSLTQPVRVLPKTSAVPSGV